MAATRQILGIRFFNQDVSETVAFVTRHGGLLVAPSATCFARLRYDEPYRRAVAAADLAIADSGWMVLMWHLLRHEKIRRISGLKYLHELLSELKGERTTDILWVLPDEDAREKLLAWSHREGIAVDPANCYIAPQYGLDVEDRHLVSLIERRRPRHILIAIGSGPQEKLGYYLRENLSCRPAIHCTGAALAFITGDQIGIPDWADRLYLGWFLRMLSQPRHFIPRLWRAHELPWLIWNYGENLPPLSRKLEKKNC